MKSFLFFLVLIFLHLSNLKAQELFQDFLIKLPDYKISNSLYNKIELIDSRLDVTDFGMTRVAQPEWEVRVGTSVHIAKEISIWLVH